MTTVLLADATFLLSPWKPILIWGAFAAWGWLVGSRLFGDSMRTRQGHSGWAMAWILCGFAGLITMLTVVNFFIAFPSGLVVLLAPILIYWKKRNASVDESMRYHLKFGADAKTKAARKQAKRAAANATLAFEGPNGAVPVPDKEDPLLVSWLHLESLILPTLEKGGTRVDLALTSGGLASTSMVHTVRSKQEPIAGEDGMRAINLLKEIAGLDQAETRKRQTARIEVNSDELGRHTLDLTLSGSSQGIRGRIDIDRGKTPVMKADAVGLLPDQLAVLEKLVPEEKRSGIVLVASPSAHGTTTTGYAIAGMHDAYLSMIKTLEQQIEGRLEGVDQVTIEEGDAAPEHAIQLQSMLRRDPDVIVAQLADPQTASVAARAGQDSTLQVLLLNADSAMSAIRTWVQSVGDVNLAAKGLQAVVAQRLVRVLCHDCRQAVQPADPKRLGLSEGAVIYRASGQVEFKNRMQDCPTCNATGFTGVTGIFEVMPVTADIRRLLAGGDLKGAMAQARRERMRSLQEAGLRRVAEGITSLEEVQRVLSSGTKAKAKPKASTAGQGSAS